MEPTDDIGFLYLLYTENLIRRWFRFLGGEIKLSSEIFWIGFVVIANLARWIATLNINASSNFRTTNNGRREARISAEAHSTCFYDWSTAIKTAQLHGAGIEIFGLSTDAEGISRP
jgi:hypothetical protein